ncbi:uncharacterized protein M6B38_389180 [Iris pallida]|uniref:Uncharacterized protein n=1 Tax=Iris pallida TaxID=29817 RepID=A0AAX6G163_IRIPA|nr:uncharacterized protein M6B38_389180 [Iris pallida]
MANPRRGASQFHHHNAAATSSLSPSPQTHKTLLLLPFSTAFSLPEEAVGVPVPPLRLRPPHLASLRLQRTAPPPPPRSRVGTDADANLVRFEADAVAKDARGWLLDPVLAARDAGVLGGAQFCSSIHVGEIRPGGMRGNHRHHTCNETFVIWGADTRFRLENGNVQGDGYAEVGFSSSEVIVAASPAGTAHALINVDRVRTSFFLGCQDSVIDNNSSTTDYKVWKDL